MTTRAVSTAGLRLQRGDGSIPAEAEAFTTLGEITSLSGPNQTATPLDATSLSSPANEYITALDDGGEVEVEFNFVADDAAQAGLRADFTACRKHNFRIELGDATDTLVVPSRWAFAAVVTALGMSFKAGGAMKGNATLKITGRVVFAARRPS